MERRAEHDEACARQRSKPQAAPRYTRAPRHCEPPDALPASESTGLSSGTS